MRFILTPTLPAVAILAALGCARPPAQFTAADHDANRALSAHFREQVLAKNWDAVALQYADSAVLLPPNMPAIKGRAAIRAYLSQFPPLSELTLTDDTIVGTGDRAYAIGRYHMTIAATGSPVDSGKFLDVRERQADGSWIYVADMFSSSIPEPAAH